MFMEAEHSMGMIRKYFAIGMDDHGGARDEVNAPNVAKFFAKHSRACLRGDDELVWEDCGPLTAF